MLREEFEPTTLVFERAKTVCAATAIVKVNNEEQHLFHCILIRWVTITFYLDKRSVVYRTKEVIYEWIFVRVIR
jgi:hypothetical protein